MNYNLSPHLKAFNDRVRMLANNRSITLSAEEARGLHHEIVDMLNWVATQSTKNQPTKQEVVQINMDGGTF